VRQRHRGEVERVAAGALAVVQVRRRRLVLERSQHAGQALGVEGSAGREGSESADLLFGPGTEQDGVDAWDRANGRERGVHGRCGGRERLHDCLVQPGQEFPATERRAREHVGAEILGLAPEAPIAEHAVREGFEATLLPGAPAGFQAIHLRRPAIEVRGVVPAAAARTLPPGTSFGIGELEEGASAPSATGIAPSSRPARGFMARGEIMWGVALRPTEVWVGGTTRRGRG
jgi:hypothetical protein